MKKLNHIIVLAALALLPSCVKEAVQASIEGEYVTINAYMADGGQKTTLIDGGINVNWEAGDAINVFVGDGNYRFNNASAKLAPSAAFVSDSPVTYTPSIGDDETFLVAVYPYNPEMTFDGACVTTTLPSEQTAREGSFASGANLAIGRSSSFDVGFRNVCSGIRFTLTRENVKTVTLESIGNENIAGKIKIGFDEDGLPVAIPTYLGKSAVILTAPAGQNFVVGKQYYICCLPGTLSKGIRLRFDTYSDNGVMRYTAEKTVTGPVTFKRGVFKDCPNVDQGLTYSSFSCLYGVHLWESRPGEIKSLAGYGWGYDGIGLYINAGTDVILDRFHSLGERMVRYEIYPTGDAVVRFHSDADNTAAVLDVPNKRIYIASSPEYNFAQADFLKGDSHYTVEITHRYHRHEFKVIDQATGRFSIVTAEEDGCGGVGRGALKTENTSCGIFRDKYCIALDAGAQVHVRTIHIFSLKDHMKLLIVGDSISQPEGYYPKADLSNSWTQLVINAMGGNAMSAGRGGGNIYTILDYIKNELPYIHPEYVMITIGTNGGNTQANLSELVEYIQGQGATPVLNNMPCNESGTQVTCLSDIQAVRNKYNISGVLFDVATSIGGDGKEVNKDMMYWEDYNAYPAPMTGWQVYHHPNPVGALAMYQRIVMDVPELFK